MSQPVKLSDGLVLDARLAGEAGERSIAGQVEFWAKLGRSVEMLLDGRQVLTLRRSAEMQPLSEALASVDTPAGRKRVADVLASKPFPHFNQYPGDPALLIRTDADGKRTVGRFVNREFVPVKVEELVPGNAIQSVVSRTKRKKSGIQPRAKTTPVSSKARSARQPKERAAWG